MTLKSPLEEVPDEPGVAKRLVTPGIVLSEDCQCPFACLCRQSVTRVLDHPAKNGSKFRRPVIRELYEPAKARLQPRIRVNESLHGLSVASDDDRSEEHTSELQSRLHLVC